MGLFFFYNNRKPRKFNHQPILYNPDEEARKERMEKRILRMKQELAEQEGREFEMPKEEKKTDFGEEFLSQTKYLKRRKEREQADNTPFFTRNVTLVLILVILATIFYFVFFK